MTALLSLLTGGNGLIAGLVAVLIAIGGAWLKGRSMGANSERDKQIKQRMDSIQKAKDVDDEISNLGSNDIDQRFSKWLRDKE